MPTCSGAVQFSLDRTGWVWDGGRLLATLDAQRWVDITPVHVQEFGGFCRVDSTHGWITAVVGSGNSAAVTVWRTTDGGVTWHSSLPVNAGVVDAGAGQVQFVDRRNGWLTVGHAGMSQSVDTYASNDSGLTWRRVAGVGYYGDLDFVSPSVGWFSNYDGAAADGWGLWHTDNGNSWQRFIESPLPASGGYCDSTFYGPVSFMDRTHGVLITVSASAANCSGAVVQPFATDNGGATWRKTQNVSVAGGHPAPDLTVLTPSVWAIADSDSRSSAGGLTGLVWTFDAGNHWVHVSAHGLGNTYAADPKFLSSHEGWLMAPPLPGGIPNGQRGSLFHTMDGGHTWTMVALPS